MKRLWIGLGLLAFATLAFSQPPIPDAAKAKFFKASSESLSASAQAQQAAQVAQAKQGTFQEAVKALRDICGKDFDLSLDKNGDPECVAKAAAPKTTVPKEK